MSRPIYFLSSFSAVTMLQDIPQALKIITIKHTFMISLTVFVVNSQSDIDLTGQNFTRKCKQIFCFRKMQNLTLLPANNKDADQPPHVQSSQKQPTNRTENTRRTENTKTNNKLPTRNSYQSALIGKETVLTVD